METTLQYRLEKACNKTSGKFHIDKELELAVCDFGTHKIELEKNNLAILNAPKSSAKFWATDIGNTFTDNIPKYDQGIWVRAYTVSVEIDSHSWHIVEKGCD